MTYEESKASIHTWPKTWLPGLLIEIVKVAIEKKVFVPGGATRLVKKTESTSWAICPFCGHGSYLIEGKLYHDCIPTRPLP